MNTPTVVSPDEWTEARNALLVKEKELTCARDALAAERRRMPWMEMGSHYRFDTPAGSASLLDLFAGRRQLIVYRAFFEDGVFGWPERPCRGCSMVADQVAHLAHLHTRDTTLVFASRAPQAAVAAMKERMGWTMPWVTITDDFDRDLNMHEWHATNAFLQHDGTVYRTYMTDARGDEVMGGTWAYLDITALGRQEKWEDSPEGCPQTDPYQWWNWHDSYEQDSRDPEWLRRVDGGVEALGGTKRTDACC